MVSSVSMRRRLAVIKGSPIVYSCGANHRGNRSVRRLSAAIRRRREAGGGNGRCERGIALARRHASASLGGLLRYASAIGAVRAASALAAMRRAATAISARMPSLSRIDAEKSTEIENFGAFIAIISARQRIMRVVISMVSTHALMLTSRRARRSRERPLLFACIAPS